MSLNARSFCTALRIVVTFGGSAFVWNRWFALARIRSSRLETTSTTIVSMTCLEDALAAKSAVFLASSAVRTTFVTALLV